MWDKMSLDKVIRPTDPEDWALHFCYVAESLVKTAYVALENDSIGHVSDEAIKMHAADTLEVALAFIGAIRDGTEEMTMTHGYGAWKKEAVE